jgi:hypothetical protein
VAAALGHCLSFTRASRIVARYVEDAAMAIPLPTPAWRVELTPECNFYNSPLGDEFNKYNLGLNEEEFPELYVSRSFDGEKLKNDPRVVRMEAVWVICPYDFTRPHEEIDGLGLDDYFGKRLGGEWVGNCLGQARVYRTRKEALSDLAKCDRGVELVFQAAMIRTGPVGALARAVLAGDMSVLPPLADALAEAGHPLAEQVKELAVPPKKGRSRKKK